MIIIIFSIAPLSVRNDQSIRRRRGERRKMRNKEEGAESEKRRRGSTLLSLADEDGRTG